MKPLYKTKEEFFNSLYLQYDFETYPLLGYVHLKCENVFLSEDGSVGNGKLRSAKFYFYESGFKKNCSELQSMAWDKFFQAVVSMLTEKFNICAKDIRMMD
jgi:hypothetical protein